MLTYIGQSNLCRSKVPFPTLKVTGYVYTYNYAISSVALLPWTPLEASVRWEEKIWCLNIKSIELKSPVSPICKMSSGCMDLCTFFGIWDTDRALANWGHPSIFGTLAIFTLQCSYMSLRLVSKLKLNTWVLKYLSTPWGYSDTPCGTA